MDTHINKLLPLLQDLDINHTINNILDYFKTILSKYIKIKQAVFVKYSYLSQKFIPINQKPIPKNIEKLLLNSLNKKGMMIHSRSIIIPLFRQSKPLAFLYFRTNKKLPSNYKKNDIETSIKLCSLIYYNAAIYNAAIKDSLTKIYNIRYFNQRLKEYYEDFKDTNKKISIIMIDIDHFKHYNDKYGHQIGDVILKDLAGTINSLIKDEGLFARYGGEEFILLLPNYDTPKTAKIAEKIRKEVEKIRISNKEYFWKLTVSLGTCTFPDDANHPEELIRCADMSLYHSKMNGRNRVSVYSYDVKKK